MARSRTATLLLLVFAVSSQCSGEENFDPGQQTIVISTPGVSRALAYLENITKESLRLQRDSSDVYQESLRTQKRSNDFIKSIIIRLANKVGDQDESLRSLEKEIAALRNRQCSNKPAFCTPAFEEKLKKQVQEYNTKKEWEPLNTTLGQLLDHDSDAYQQLQTVSFINSMYWVAYRGNKELLDVLVSCGGAVNVADYSGTTMLLGAATSGKTELVKWLLANGAYIEAKDPLGCTPLVNAAFDGHLETVKYLVYAGASTTVKTKDGNTALELAIDRHHFAIAEYLSHFPQTAV